MAKPGGVLSHQKISATEGGFTGTLEFGDAFGWSVASLGDLDGVGDLAVGAAWLRPQPKERSVIRTGERAGAARKRPRLVVLDAAGARPAPRIVPRGEIHGETGRLRLNRVGRVGRMAA